MPPEGRERRPSAPGIPGYRLPGARLTKPVVEVEACSQSTPPGASLPPSSARKAWRLEGPQGFRLVVPVGLLAFLGPLAWNAVKEVVQARQELRETVALVAKFQGQLDALKQADSALELRDAKHDARMQSGEDWNGAVLSQALGVDIRRRDNAPALPALRITVPLRKPNRIDARAPLVVVETPQPTGEP